VKGTVSVRSDLRPALLLGLGFAISAALVFGVVAILGAEALGEFQETMWAGAVAAGFVAALALTDTGAFGLRTPMWRRQTPKWYAHRFSGRVTGFLWGLDAGLVFTTFRVTF
jgi:thiol:disulfide interchange protein